MVDTDILDEEPSVSPESDSWVGRDTDIATIEDIDDFRDVKLDIPSGSQDVGDSGTGRDTDIATIEDIDDFKDVQFPRGRPYEGDIKPDKTSGDITEKDVLGLGKDLIKGLTEIIKASVEKNKASDKPTPRPRKSADVPDAIGVDDIPVSVPTGGKKTAEATQQDSVVSQVEAAIRAQRGKE